jgi:hypothetical protein
MRQNPGNYVQFAEGFDIKWCLTYPNISTFQSQITSVSKISKSATDRAQHSAYIMIKALATIHVFQQPLLMV